MPSLPDPASWWLVKILKEKKKKISWLAVGELKFIFYLSKKNCISINITTSKIKDTKIRFYTGKGI